MKKTICGILMALTALTFLGMVTAEMLRRPAPAAPAEPETTAEAMAETVSVPSAAPEAPADRETGKPEIYALFGVDAEDGEAGRSDCILLLSLNGDTLRMCSLARDTLVTIPGTGEETKLGHAYAYGGPDLALETIRENFGVDVRRYAAVNFSQMPRLIELVGGVEVPLSQAEWEALSLDAPYLGYSNLDGSAALRYCRLRAIDSDDQRTARQRTVVRSMLASIRKLPKSRLPALALEGIRLTRTNLGPGEVLRLGRQALAGGSALRVESLAIPGDSVSAWGGIRPDGAWYYVYDLSRAGEALEEFFSGGGGSAAPAA